jgi:hypothetical protein
MAGPFDWGTDKEKGATQGKGEKLPRHIERMNAGTKEPEAKGSVMKGNKSTSDSGLPWGGEPAEKSKAYMTGLPKNKGSMLNKTGERTGSESKGAHCGYEPTIKSKPMGMNGMKKK